MPQLDTSSFSSQLFWLGVCFLVLYFILAYIAVPKIIRVLEMREGAIEENINKASLYREQAENLLADYEATLAQAREMAQEHSQTVMNAAVAEKAQKEKDFLDKLHERLHVAEQDLYRSRLEAGSEIKSMASDVANMILRKLLGNAYPLDKPLGKRKDS